MRSSVTWEDASLAHHERGVLGMSPQQEVSEKTHNMLGGLRLSAGLECLSVPADKLEVVFISSEVGKRLASSAAVK